MTESAVKRASDSPNMGDLLEDVLLQAKTLVQAELSLAKREVSSELRATSGSLLLLYVAAMCVQSALTTAGVLIVFAFGVGAAAGALIAGLLAVAVVCALVAVRELKKRKLPRTSARLALDAKQVLETVK